MLCVPPSGLPACRSQTHAHSSPSSGVDERPRGSSSESRKPTSTEDPLVSTDIIGNPYSCIYDSLATMVSGNLIKTLSWYDNEWGYSNRVVDAMAYTSSLDS